MDTWRKRVSLTAEEQSLRARIRFYGRARFALTPNEAMVHMLRQRAGKHAFLMAHGVDTEVYSPQWRRRRNRSFRIGYVGRLTAEKNVRLFADLERSLVAQGRRDFRFTLIGEGGERDWLRKNLEFGETPGILHGKALAEAFANMDVFVFPSQTDTLGLLLEAMASGVPVVVSPETGAHVGIRHGVTGFHAPDMPSFTEAVRHLMNSETLRQRSGAAARALACPSAWNGVFEGLYQTYERGLEAAGCKPDDRTIAESQTTS